MLSTGRIPQLRGARPLKYQIKLLVAPVRLTEEASTGYNLDDIDPLRRTSRG